MASDPVGWDLSRVWDALRKFWLLVVGLTLAGGIVGYALSSTISPQYQASATMYFAFNSGTSGADLNQGSTYTQNQLLSFAQLATSSRVLQPVIDQLELDRTPRELARSVAITIPQDTVILKLTATASGPHHSAEIANEVAARLSVVVKEVAPKDANGDPTITASLFDEAVAPTVQSVPNKTRDAVLAAALGFFAGVSVALLLAVLDTRVRNEEAVALVTDHAVLGLVGKADRGADAGLVVAREPHSHLAEDFRRLHSALAFTALGGSSKRLLVTSASPGEGKSTFSANLALALSDTGDRALLVDADLRRPRVHELFGVDKAVGVTSVLIGDADLETAIFPWRESGPDILASGELPPNPATVVTSDAFRGMLDSAAERYDVVIVDSPPVLAVADTNLLASLVDGVVIVVDASKTRRAQLANTVRSLESAGARILGIVLNKATRPGHRVAYYSASAKSESSAN